CEFVGIPGRPREPDPLRSAAPSLVEVATIEREDRLRPWHGWKPGTERGLGSFCDGDEVCGPLEIAAHCGCPRGPGGDHGNEWVTVAARDRARGRGPVHREVADAAV